jgi:hypothetical protein
LSERPDDGRKQQDKAHSRGNASGEPAQYEGRLAWTLWFASRQRRIDPGQQAGLDGRPLGGSRLGDTARRLGDNRRAVGHIIDQIAVTSPQSRQRAHPFGDVFQLVRQQFALSIGHGNFGGEAAQSRV